MFGGRAPGVRKRIYLVAPDPGDAVQRKGRVNTTIGKSKSATAPAASRLASSSGPATNAAGALADPPVAVLYFFGTTMIDANAEWIAVSCLGIDESAGDGWLRAIHPDDRADVSKSIATATSGVDVDLNVRVVAADGGTAWFRGRLRCFGDPVDQARLLTFTAIGEHRGNEARLLLASTHDGSTGFADRTTVDAPPSPASSTRPDLPRVATTGASDVDQRAHQLQSALDLGQAVEQAIGMIAQHFGTDTGASTRLLRQYAAANALMVEEAARMVVGREVDIDTLASVAKSAGRNRAERTASPSTSLRTKPQRPRTFNQIYGEHAAAVYASALFIGGCDPTAVTEATFLEFWHQQHIARSGHATERAQLMTIAHRLAMRAAISHVLTLSDTESPSALLDEVLSRGQAIERTLACIDLDPNERSVAALVVYGRCLYPEVAQVLGEPEADINRKLGTTLRHLRTALTARQ